MPTLPTSAVEHLWPVLVIIGLVVFLLSTVVVGLVRGFKWLREEISSIAEEVAEKVANGILSPMADDVSHLKRSARRAHFRITRLRADAGLPPDSRDDYDTGEDTRP